MHTEAVPETVDIGTPASRPPTRALPPNETACSKQAPSVCSPMSPPESALTAPVLSSSLSTLDPATACASPGSTVWDARCASCSKPSTASRPAASTWSVSRSASTPLRPPASSYSTSSVRLRTSRDGSSPSAPATASRRRENSSKSDCHPLERQKNSSVLAGQRLTDSPRRCAKRLLRP